MSCGRVRGSGPSGGWAAERGWVRCLLVVGGSRRQTRCNERRVRSGAVLPDWLASASPSCRCRTQVAALWPGCRPPEVVWLNELQDYLDGRSTGWMDRVVRALLEPPAVIIGTMCRTVMPPYTTVPRRGADESAQAGTSSAGPAMSSDRPRVQPLPSQGLGPRIGSDLGSALRVALEAAGCGLTQTPADAPASSGRPLGRRQTASPTFGRCSRGACHYGPGSAPGSGSAPTCCARRRGGATVQAGRRTAESPAQLVRCRPWPTPPPN